MTEIELAEAVARMLVAQGVTPVPERVFVAPLLERNEITCRRIFVSPGDITGEVINRRGDLQQARQIDLAVVDACPPDHTARIGELLGLCRKIVDTLARHAPVDEQQRPLGIRALTVNQEPLFSREHLRAGVFLGVITAGYTP